jgi:hypothetical protein
MAGLPWIELATDLPRHRKALSLGLKLGDSRAWTYPVSLWLWCAEQCQEGRISGEDAGAILEHAMGWTGDPGKLLKACVEVGFIDADGDEYVVHGWVERAAAHIAKRRKDAERQAARRTNVARKFAPDVTHADVTVTSDGRPSESRRNSNPNTNPNTETETKATTAQGAALDHWNERVWPVLSTDKPPKADGATMKMLTQRIKEYDLETVTAAMDRFALKAASDEWLRTNVTLITFLSGRQFPKFLARAAPGSGPPKPKSARGHWDDMRNCWILKDGTADFTDTTPPTEAAK